VTELVRAERPKQGKGLLAVGGVDYGRDDGEKARPDARPSLASTRAAPIAAGAALRFDPLPGTSIESEEVVALYRRAKGGEAESLSAARATKDRVRAAMAGRRYLHLATHGYFAPPGLRSLLAPEDDRTSLRPFEGMGRREVSGWYPGLLSGLVWAGANRPVVDRASGVVDLGAGLMTAEEVSGLDLRGCETAVLSACETGLGRTAGGEGVLGLQRAFHQAGCRTVIASLWKVDDAATSALMQRFYDEHWGKDRPPLEALRRAQLSLLDAPDFGGGENPHLWAAWVLSGDPGDLPRPRPPKAVGGGGTDADRR
jgi:CHAT domain-containing protein